MMKTEFLQLRGASSLADANKELVLESVSVDANNMLKELNKITDNDKKEAIEQLLFTPFYSETYVDDEAFVNKETSSIETIQYLNKFSGNELDKKIAEQLKDTINNKIQDPDCVFPMRLCH